MFLCSKVYASALPLPGIQFWDEMFQGADSRMYVMSRCTQVKIPRRMHWKPIDTHLSVYRRLDLEYYIRIATLASRV